MKKTEYRLINFNGLVKNEDYMPTIRIVWEGTGTNWLNITEQELEQIKVILTKEAIK